MAPIAPHWAEELWHAVLGREGSVHTQPWPEFDPNQAKADEVELAVQVNGKVKAKIMVAANAAEDDIKAAGLAAVEAALAGKDVKKVVVVPGPFGERGGEVAGLSAEQGYSGAAPSTRGRPCIMQALVFRRLRDSDDAATDGFAPEWPGVFRQDGSLEWDD